MNIRKQVLQYVLLAVVTVIASLNISYQISVADEQAYIEEDDIVYGMADDIELKLNLARPTTGDGPFPALIFLFGGGYRYGSRQGFYHEIQEAAQRGYVAVSIDYRLTNVLENEKVKYTFPSQVHDAKCAVRWLRANASKYKIDINHIGVLGYSSGGNLALMVGLTDPSTGLECGNMKYSSRVQAVVNLGGGTDMVMQYKIRPFYYEPYMGGTPDDLPEQYKLASPITHISKDDPPVLSVYGDMDPGLPQAEIFDIKMKEMGISHSLIIVEGKGHSYNVDFDKDYPVWDFFEEHLKED